MGNSYCTVMPFSIKNGEATYQHAMNAIFRDMLQGCLEDYVNDIVVKLKEVGQHSIMESLQEMPEVQPQDESVEMRILNSFRKILRIHSSQEWHRPRSSQREASRDMEPPKTTK